MIYLPNKKTFTANIIIGASIAFFIYFLKESLLLEHALAYFIAVLLKVHFTLIRNRFYYAPSTINFASDIITIVIAAYFWTYLAKTGYKLAGNSVLAIILIPVSFFIYRKYGVILTSFLIVCGVIINIVVEAALDHMSKLFHLKILEEKQEAEFSILRHLNHNVKPNIQIAKSPLNAVADFLEEHGLLGKVLARRLDGSEETIGEALQKTVMSLDQISDILDSTRKLVTQQIAAEEFRQCGLVDIFTKEIVPLYSGKFRINIDGDPRLTVRLHRESFIEAINNLVRNAEVHAFPGSMEGAELNFVIRERRKRVIIDYTNNGRPFPANLTERDFLSFGKKSSESPGEGLGGAWIGKVIEAHHGTFEIIRDENPVHFRFALPKK
ncbi:MAG TPA: ATP-binding protein [Geobacteraceae bacterium]|nr:ATP-binding protein [Geobacteraceae bacterium]